MLGFFRRYQRYVFLVVTFVIIVSFSFFGTYNTIPAENIREQVAFTAIDGTQVSRADLEEMVLFLSTDADDKVIFGGAWGPNFLNDGVIRKDFLQTGLAEILAVQYEPALAADLQKRLEKERRNVLYSHPDASFLSVEAVWNYFSPDMKTNYNNLKRANKGSSEDAIAARIRLYLGERRMPPPLLRQVLRYQEKQNAGVKPDPNLDRTDLSLFGYHSIDDWFGPNFVRIISEFVINAAKVAEQKGYVVTKEEAFSDLVRNAQASYQQNLQNPNLSVSNSGEYLNEQLRRMTMDQGLAVKLWRQVLLFRRLFQDIGQSVLVDTFSFEQINQYAKESASGTLYQLPRDLQINSYEALQKLETYLSAVSKRPTDESKVLTLPTEFLSASEVSKKYPELVEKRYFIEFSQVDKKNLQTKVSVKDSWNWQVEDKNWATLKKEFPELATKKGDTREERFAALESLDNRTRSRVDAFTRNAILDTRSEIVVAALNDAEVEQQAVGLTQKGNNPPFTGLKDPKKLMALLDAAPLAGEEGSASDASKKAQEQLNIYSDNNQNYYRIRVLERKPDLEVLTFAEANKRGALNTLVESELDAYYQKNRAQNASAYQNADKSWKPFADVRTAVADQYYAKVLKAIRQEYAKTAPKDKKQELTTGENAAPYRMYAYVKTAKESLEKTPEKGAAYVRQSQTIDPSHKLADKEPLANQWLIEEKDYIVERSKDERKLNAQEVLNLAVGSWTALQVSPNGDVYFFKKTSDKGSSTSPLVLEKVDQARRLMSDDSQRAYMRSLIVELKNKNAISLDYLNQSYYEMVPEQPAELEG